MTQDDEHVPVLPDTWMPARSGVMKEAHRNWMAARIRALKREHPKWRKRDCWRVANKEWLEMRRLQSRALRGTPTRAGYKRIV